MEEIWKDIDGYEGKYKISNYGRVKSLQRVSKNGAKIKERILNPSPQKNGYVQVHLSTDDGYRWELVHRLVANAFLRRKTESDCIVNHLDNNPSNNKLDNLEWTTYKGNILYVHVLEWNKNSITVPVGNGGVLSVSSLTCEKFSCNKTDTGIELSVPADNRQAADTIFKIEFDKPVGDIYNKKETDSPKSENNFTDRAINLGEL
jgi:hypothetical protein